MARKPTAGVPSSLEREVIAAVVILYVVLCAVMLAIHYLQPQGADTLTSSTSPSHESFSSAATPRGAAARP